MDLIEYEKRILNLEAMKFEDLVHDLLLKEYPNMENVSHLGRQVGRAVPTKGPVDIWFTSKKDKFEVTTFVEITSQQTSLRTKIISDLKKATKEINKNKIKVNEVIYACTGRISPETYKEAKGILNNVGIIGEFNLKFWGIDEIVRLLKTYYPILAEKYLGIKINNGCIVPIKEYGNKFNVVQDNIFLFREVEKEAIMRILQTDKAIVLYGPAGCGKTRIALQIFKELQELNHDSECHVVKMSGVGLFEDLKSLLNDTQKMHYVLVDDANRTNYIGDIANFIERQNNIRIIFTVRDYAVDSVMRALIKTGIQNYEIKPFKQEDVVEIIKQGFGIERKSRLDYILEVSKGNLRFAVMAAQLINEKGKGVKQLSDLLEEYFNDVRERIEALSSDKLAEKVLAALSLFKRLDIRDKNLITEIGKVFGFSEIEFYDICDELDIAETINYHFDKSAIEIADQILADYLFYKIAIKEKKLNLKIIFEKFLCGYKNRFLDLFQSIINIYGLNESLLSQLRAVFAYLEENNRREIITKYLGLFHGLIPNETLQFVINKLEEIPANEEREYHEFGKDFYAELLEILSCFSNSDYDEYAIDILIDTLMKKPGMYKELKHSLCESFTINNVSHINRYHTQNYLLEKIIGLKEYDNYLDLLSDVLNKQFSLSQRSTEAKGRSVTFYTVEMLNMEESRHHRNLIWQGINILFENSVDLKKIYKIVSSGTYIETGNELRKIDKNYALQFCERLDLSVFGNKMFAINLLGHYKKMQGVKSFIDSLLTDSTLRFYYENLNYITGKFIHGKELKNAIKKLCDTTSFDEIINGLSCIAKHVAGGNSEWNCNNAIELVFDVIYERDKDAFCELVLQYIQSNPETGIRPLVLLKNLNSILELSAILSFLEMSDLKHKCNWIAQCLVCVPQDKIDDDIYEYAFNFFSNTYPETTLWYGNERADSLLNFENYRKGFISNVVKAYQRLDNKMALKHFCELLFSDEYTFDEILSVFNNDIELMKNVYLTLAKTNALMDLKGNWLNMLFKEDSENQYKLLKGFIEEKHAHIPHIAFYKFNQFTDMFIDVLADGAYWYLNNQIHKLIFGMDDSLFKSFICEYFERNKNNYILMRDLSILMEDASKERQVEFAKSTVEHKVSIDIMRRMFFFGGPSSWTNSRIPHIKKNIEILEKFIEEYTMGTKYKLFFNERLERLRNHLKSTEIEEFNRDLLE